MVKTSRFFKTALLSCALLSGSLRLSSQTTIGSIFSPVSGALLDLKEYNPDANNATSKKGLLLPKIALISLVDFNTVVPGASTTDKKDHDGLLVYNVGDSRVCSGIHIWNQQKWDRYPKACQVNTLCNSIVVNGIYEKGKVLDGTHTITLDIEVPKEATKGGTYSIYTDTLIGISFSATTGNLVEGKTRITLQGSGTPVAEGIFSFTLTGSYSNSVSSPLTCTVPVTVYNTLKSVKILGFGLYTGTYGYHTESSGSRKMLTTLNNYGTLATSTVRTEPPTFPTPLSIDAIGTNFANSIATLNPDIIINGYHSHAPNNPEGIAAIDALVEYLKNGGILILNDEYKTAATSITARILSKLYPSSTISVVPVSHSGAIYPINPDINDEITNGPFGDLRGLYWGEDASDTAGITGLPEDEIIAYSRNIAGGNAISAVTMFRLKKYNLFFVGDGGFTSNPGTLIGNHTSSIICPFSINSSYAPIPRIQWGTPRATVNNSQMFANLIYWSMINSKTNK